jgi:hypothetical protein
MQPLDLTHEGLVRSVLADPGGDGELDLAVASEIEERFDRVLLRTLRPVSWRRFVSSVSRGVVIAQSRSARSASRIPGSSPPFTE